MGNPGGTITYARRQITYPVPQTAARRSNRARWKDSRRSRRPRDVWRI